MMGMGSWSRAELKAEQGKEVSMWGGVMPERHRCQGLGGSGKDMCGEEEKRNQIKKE